MTPSRGSRAADVYQMMAYAQLYNAPRMTLLYPHHPGLGYEAAVHARYRITGHATTLETAVSIYQTIQGYCLSFVIW